MLLFLFTVNVFNSDAACNSNFDGVASLHGNWLSAPKDNALQFVTDSDVSTDLSV